METSWKPNGNLMETWWNGTHWNKWNSSTEKRYEIYEQKQPLIMDVRASQSVRNDDVSWWWHDIHCLVIESLIRFLGTSKAWTAVMFWCCLFSVSHSFVNLQERFRMISDGSHGFQNCFRTVSERLIGYFCTHLFNWLPATFNPTWTKNNHQPPYQPLGWSYRYRQFPGHPP